MGRSAGSFKRRVVVVGLAVGSVVSGCAGDSGGDVGQAGDSAGSLAEDGSAADVSPEPGSGVAGLSEPPNPALQFWGGSNAVDRNLIVPVDDLIFLEEAQQELISRCMERQGFQFTPVKVEPHLLSGPLDNLNMFWLQSLEQAEQWGYGGPSAFRNEDAPGGVPSFTDPDAEYLNQLSQKELDSYDDALMGTGLETTEAEARLLEEDHARGEYVEMWMNTDGCIGTTEAAIYGDLSQFMRLNFVVRSSIRNDVKARVEAASVFVEAVDDWQECMQQQGYDFDDPWGALDAVGDAYYGIPPYDTLTPEEVTALETQIATADGRCAEETGLFDVAESELAQAVRDVTAEREGEILGYREMIATAVDNAKALLATG